METSNPIFLTELRDIKINSPLINHIYQGVRKSLLPESYFQVIYQYQVSLFKQSIDQQTQYIWLIFSLLTIRSQGHVALSLNKNKKVDYDFIVKQLDGKIKTWFIDLFSELNNDNLLPQITIQSILELENSEDQEINPIKIFKHNQITPQDIFLDINKSTPYLIYGVDEGDQLHLAFSGNFKLEQQVKLMLLTRAKQTSLNVYADFKDLIEKTDFFGITSEEQKDSVLGSVEKNLAVVIGGPGTGKTTTVRKLILLNALFWYYQNDNLPLIALTAPTGKAAKRLEESVNKDLEQDLCKINQIIDNFNQISSIKLDGKTFIDHVRLQLTVATSLHKKVGYPNYDMFSAHNNINSDILIIDEASMIGLSLFQHTLKVLRSDAQLIIMGDANQLPSVDIGAILAVISNQRKYPTSILRPCIKTLTKNFRSGEVKDIAELSVAIAEDRTSTFLQRLIEQQQIVKDNKQESNQLSSEVKLHLYNISKSNNTSADFEVNNIIKEAETWFKDYYQEVIELYHLKQNKVSIEDYTSKIKSIFKAFKKNRLLLANNSGSFGVVNFNKKLQTRLSRKYLEAIPLMRDKEMGKPIQIRSNMPNGLVNGDLCILLPDYEYDNMMFWVESNDGIKKHPIELISDYDVSYSITVHKSQGDEFEHTIFILPMNLTLFHTKEIFYTAITRAKKRLTIFAPPSITKVDLETIAKQTTLDMNWD